MATENIVFVGGYTFLHLFNELSQHMDLITSKVKVHFFLSVHFSNYCHEDYMEENWGQHKDEFPIHGQGLIDGNARDWIKLKEVKKFTETVRQNLRERIRNTPDKKFKVNNYSSIEIAVGMQEDNKGVFLIRTDQGLSYSYPQDKTILFDCRLIPRKHDDENLQGFPITEDFFARPLTKAPVVLFGTGPSAMWIADICRRNNTEFKWQNKLSGSRILDVPRNADILTYIQEHAQTLSVSGNDWVVRHAPKAPREFQDQYYNDYLPALYQTKPEEAKALELCNLNELAFCFNKYGKLEKVARGINAIGYDPVSLPPETNSYYSLTLSRTRPLQDIMPRNMSGSVAHQLEDAKFWVLSIFFGAGVPQFNIPEDVKTIYQSLSGVNGVFTDQEQDTISMMYNFNITYIKETKFWDFLRRVVYDNTIQQAPQNTQRVKDLFTHAYIWKWTVANVPLTPDLMYVDLLLLQNMAVPFWCGEKTVLEATQQAQTIRTQANGIPLEQRATELAQLVLADTGKNILPAVNVPDPAINYFRTIP